MFQRLSLVLGSLDDARAREAAQVGRVIHRDHEFNFTVEVKNAYSTCAISVELLIVFQQSYSTDTPLVLYIVPSE